MPRVYKRTYRKLIREAKAKANALVYPAFKVGDRVTLVKDILDIDARITGITDGYVGEQVRRRMRYRYLSKNSTRGKIVKISIADIYVQFKVKDKFYRDKFNLGSPVLVRKQMIIKTQKHVKSNSRR